MMETKYCSMGYDWNESNGDHIYTLDVEFVSIDDPSNLKVSVKNGKVIEIEAVVAAAFHNGERLDQLGIPKDHAMRVACNKAITKYEKETNTLNKPKLTIMRHRASFLIESQPVCT